ncbi:MAG TPA: serine hydrolase [Candidatus Saccharimonadales bacterium]
MQRIKDWILKHKKPILMSCAGLVLLIVIIQIIYPASQLLPSTTIDAVKVGGLAKPEAVKKLDKVYANQKMALALNDEEKVVTEFKAFDIGLSAHNSDRIASYDYPLLYRLIPTSLLWYSPVSSLKPVQYDRDEGRAKQFIAKQFGDACVIQPKDATIKVLGQQLEAVPAKDGGKCSSEEVLRQLQDAKITPGRLSTVRVSVDVTHPEITSEIAQELADTIERSSKNGVTIDVKDVTKTIAKDDLYKWLAFTAKDKKLNAILEPKKAQPYLDKTIVPIIAVAAGKTEITTRDFTVVSEKKGAKGVTLDTTKTLAGIVEVMEGGKQKAVAVTRTLQPSVTYKRSYTKTSTGISAMLQHYAEDQTGEFGVSFMELGGSKSAQYNSTKSFITASTYKLFVAYDTLRKVEKGDWSWSDSVVDGRNLSTCFDDMIVKSDNNCAEALYKKIGYKKVIEDVRKLGLGNTVLAKDGQRTTAGDLSLFLSKLYSGSLGLKTSSKDRLLSAMKRNVYRSGIPAGASGTVADKVGFLNGLLHDASIVYSPKGNYILVIMSDGSSWANLAEITRKIESLR